MTLFRKILERYLLPGALLVLAWPLAAQVTQVDNDALANLMNAGVPVVDIRTPGEWRKTGVVEGSHLLTFFNQDGQYDVKAFLAQLGKIAGQDEPVVLICESGGRTGVVTRFLDKKAGYSQVHDVSKGIRAWINAGRRTAPANLP